MYTVRLRFYEELNYFLPDEHKKKEFQLSFDVPRSVKDLIESIGVPHVEVDLILVNGRSVPFEYTVMNGDRISIFPEFETLDIGGVTHLRPVPLRRPRFVLDVHLKSLAHKLRLLGLDTDYKTHREDSALAEISNREKRTLLTRDKQLLMRKVVTRGLYIRNTDPVKQVHELFDRMALIEFIDPFSRCLDCNGKIETIERSAENHDAIEAIVPAGVLAWCSQFYRCKLCKKIYWKGSHFSKMNDFVEEIRERYIGQ